IKASFDVLLTQYPSGMRVDSLLAGRNFDVHAENIILGNGAAELIKALMERLDGKTGFVRPTFEEYPNRYDKSNSVCYYPSGENFSYTADDLMEFFGDKDIENLVVINPDNPTGNYIPKKDLERLIAWSEEKDIVLVIDESFVDFADEIDSTLIIQDILDTHKKLYVMKSISKSFGVPGLRLGVLASGDIATIKELKDDVAIWNINSFAEFYMQIYEKYVKDYAKALKLFRAERTRFLHALEKIEGIRVIPSQANYFMIELTNGNTAAELTKSLLLNHNLFIKDLSSKANGEYVRIAIRNKIDNNKLIAALKAEI
ncbi:MAG: histidinol-phosphate aminotransferase family protein, partial [Clostridia bacterium]|nr:histidinol-phosphate aminotransferase family protein [Clostridia bacterium]